MRDLVKESVSTLKPYKVTDLNVDIKLDANENPYDLFYMLRCEFVKELERIGINRYPDNDGTALKNELANYTGVGTDNLILGNGSDELIQTIINTFVDKNEHVIIPVPTFSMYKVFTQIAGGISVEIPCNEEFQFDIDGIIKKSNELKAKLIFLCNPNNPTGTVNKQDDIIRVIESTNSIVVVDEAYYEFLDETMADYIYKYKRLIVLRTLSKAFALAGARIGYGIADSETIEVLNSVKSPYNLNSFSLIAGEVFLKNIELVKESIKAINIEKKYLINGLNDINGIKIFPTGSNYVMIKSANQEKIIENCFKNGVAVKGFGKDGILKDCIRITVGKRSESERVLQFIRM